MVYGAAYTLFTPLFGFLNDKGLDGLVIMLIGNFLITLGFVFIGPLPPLRMIGGHLWLTIVSMLVQGIGSAGTFLASLLYMMKSIREAGLPETDQSKGMVSSLWVVGDCIGGFVGSVLGGFAYDALGFQMGTSIEVGCMSFTLIIICGYIFLRSKKNM